MTDQEREFLKNSIDKIIVIETAAGEQIAQPLFVFAEGETPDVFYLEMEPQPDGTFKQKGQSGHSLLLADVVAVRSLA